MSIWTHVAAIIRIDSLMIPGLVPNSKKEIAKIVGSKLPLGNEGPLHYSIWQNKDRNSAAQFTLSVFGDLCDYESTAPIKEWFDELCKSFSSVRQAVCIAESEVDNTPRVFTYNR